MFTPAQIWTQLDNPKAGQQITVPADAQAQGLNLQFDPATAVMARKGDSLVFQFEDGASLTLLDFYAAYSHDTVPDFHLNGTRVAGIDFLSAFGDEFLPAAAGEQPKDMAARFHNEGHLGVLEGIDFLGALKQLPTVETSLGSSAELNLGEFTENQLMAGEFASLVASAPQPSGAPLPVNPLPTVQEAPPLLPQPPQEDRPVVELPQQPTPPPVELLPQPPQPPQPPVQPPQEPQQPTPPPVVPEVPPVQPPLEPEQPPQPPDQGGGDQGGGDQGGGDPPPPDPTPGLNERVEYVASSASDDVIWRTHLVGGAGDDVIMVGGMTATTSGGVTDGFIDAGSGDDHLIITNISGTAWNANNQAGVRGGEGDDTIDVTNGMSGGSLDGGAGNDTINIANLSGTHDWGAPNLGVNGGAGDDTINIGTMSGGKVFGDGGNDTITVAKPITGGSIDGGSGSDTFVLADSSGHTLKLTNTGTVSIDGTVYNNIKNFENLGGGDGNDTLYGNNLDNVLYGGKGNDVLFGGRGDNILYGGEGNDTFVWSEADMGGFVNTIKDFELGKDKITLDLGEGFNVLGSFEGTQGKITVTNGAGETVHTVLLDNMTSQDDVNRVVNDISASTSS